MNIKNFRICKNEKSKILSISYEVVYSRIYPTNSYYTDRTISGGAFVSGFIVINEGGLFHRYIKQNYNFLTQKVAENIRFYLFDDIFVRKSKLPKDIKIKIKGKQL